MAPEIVAATRFISPESYIPKHLAEKILTSKSALEGERKQVTVLFADLKGSMELLANRDPEASTPKNFAPPPPDPPVPSPTPMPSPQRRVWKTLLAGPAR